MWIISTKTTTIHEPKIHSDLLFLLQVPEMLPYQPNSESCLIGCYNTEEMEPKDFSRQVQKLVYLISITTV